VININPLAAICILAKFLKNQYFGVKRLSQAEVGLDLEIEVFSWWFCIANVVRDQNLPGGLLSPLLIFPNFHPKM